MIMGWFFISIPYRTGDGTMVGENVGAVERFDALYIVEYRVGVAEGDSLVFTVEFGDKRL